MKKIIFPVLAAAAIIAAPAAYARTMHDSDAGWRVLADSNSQTCFVAPRGAASGETAISGPYSSQSKALSAMGSDIQCATPESMD